MAITQADRLFGQTRAIAATQRPCAKTDNGNFEALNFDDLYHLYLPSESLAKPSRNSARRPVSRLTHAAIMGFAMLPSK